MSRSTILVLLTLACVGCTSTRWSRFAHPFASDDAVDISDPSFASSKAGQVQEIRRIARAAKTQSPAEQTESLKELVSRLQSEEDKVLRLEIVRALGNLRSPTAMEGLRIAIGDSRDAVRVAACQALGETKSRAALDLLGALVATDESLDVRVAAANAISRFQGNEAILALQPAINDSDPALQYTAVQAMKRLHSEDLGNSVAAWQDLARSLSPERKSRVALDEEEDLLR